MPRLSVWAVRTALIYLVVGSTVGALMLGAKAGILSITLLRLIPSHQELLLLGWLLQLAFGVGYWILPRVEGTRPRPALAVAGLACLNVGVLAAAIGWIVDRNQVVVLGRLLELTAAVTFLGHLWLRIRLGGLINRLTPEEVASRRRAQGGRT